MLTLRGTHFS